jgi:hypothetical protein
MSTPEFTGQEINYGYKKAIHSDSELVKKQNHTSRKQLTRCKICNKKVGILGFSCKCSSLYDEDKLHVFCPSHRHPEDHSCPIDYREIGKKELERKNPVVISSKVKNYS